MFTIADENKYKTVIKPGMGQHQGAEFENIHPSCVRKLIEGVVKYAQELGFSAHPDYKKYSPIFGDTDNYAISLTRKGDNVARGFLDFFNARKVK